MDQLVSFRANGYQGKRTLGRRIKAMEAWIAKANRLGIDTFIYLGSAVLGSICALLDRIPTVAEYMEQVKVVTTKAVDVYRHMNFDKIKEFSEVADTVSVEASAGWPE